LSITLPHIRVINKIDDFTPEKIDDVIRDCVALSAKKPCYLEAADGTVQYFLFFRERQIYSAGRIEKQQFMNITIRDFLLGSTKLHFPRLTSYEVNNKILHSILILFQKKPSLQIVTSLVDVDKLLDKIEEEKKSCIVSAWQEGFLALLRYEKGEVTALCHEQSSLLPKEETFRDDFLVKIYTLSAEKQLYISLYEDLLVKFASDAKLIDDSFEGSFWNLFLSKPPVMVLKLKDKELARLALEKPVTKIGRGQDNDIVIDNLAVSRLHAIIEEDKGSYFIKDCDSLNGTMVNGRKIDRTRLGYGDVITIGKHELVFEEQSGKAPGANFPEEEFDQTFIITPSQRDRMKERQEKHLDARDAVKGSQPAAPRLLEKNRSGDKVIELSSPSLIIGKGDEADIPIGGWFVAEQHAEIKRVDGQYVIRHLSGLRKVTVDGRPVNESVLKPNTRIRIANHEFIFLE
jgi:pSer/pThr/pTyr-binding forkhead associated (FHA) protein